MAKKSKRAQMRLRYGIVSSVLILLAFLIVTNAVKTTIVNADRWNAKADSTLNKIYIVQPNRGDILADDGTVLATTLTKYTICIDYCANARHDTLFVKKLPELADSMAKYYPQRTAKEWHLYLAKPLSKMPNERTMYHVLLNNASYADYERILTFPFFSKYKKRYDNGLITDAKEVRMRPYGSMAELSIGTCNLRKVPKIEGCPVDSDFNLIRRGYSGIESALDSFLYGKPGRARNVALTHGMKKWVSEPAVDGYTVRTTINIDMQDIVENELQNMLKATGADWGTCLLMEVATGDIKAISNLDKNKNGKYVEAMNYALQRFEPGSVMKPISMIVALEDNFAPLNKVYEIGHSYAYAGGSPIHDTHSPAALPVSRFIEYSSNIGMTKLIAPQYSNNLNGFRERLRKIGFFDAFNTGMAGERKPLFPTLDPKAGGHVSLSRMSYGYSTMIPPLYTCAIYNAIANKGKFVKPRIWKELIGTDGTVITKDVEYVRDSICSQRNAKILLDMLHSVVYGDGGTAKALKNDRVTVVGKTGTCRIAYENHPDSIKAGKPRKTGYKEGQYRLAFCGIFPYENPKYTCMVLISNPSPEHKSAARVSGMVVRNIAYKLFAHGMLDKHADFTEKASSSDSPKIYACQQNRFDCIRKSLSIAKTRKTKYPADPEQGKVPNVLGLGMRDAIARLENAGFEFTPKGSGYAVRQTPAAGTQAKPGQKVTVEFATR